MFLGFKYGISCGHGGPQRCLNPGRSKSDAVFSAGSVTIPDRRRSAHLDIPAEGTLDVFTNIRATHHKYSRLDAKLKIVHKCHEL